MTDEDAVRLRRLGENELRRADDLWDLRAEAMQMARSWHVRRAMRRYQYRKEVRNGYFDRAAVWRKQARLASDMVKACCDKIERLFHEALEAEMRARLAFEEVEERESKPDEDWEMIHARMEEAVRTQMPRRP